MKIAYIDSQNLVKALQAQWRVVDWQAFFTYLSVSHRIDVIKVFMGHLPQREAFYTMLKRIGYTVVLKELISSKTAYRWIKQGRIKGNVDVNIAVSAMQDMYEGCLSEGYMVSGDGDFAVLINVWKDNNIFGGVFTPNATCASRLLRRKAWDLIIDLKHVWKVISKKI